MAITYPPEMLPTPDEGDEAEIVVVRDDGTLETIWSRDNPDVSFIAVGTPNGFEMHWLTKDEPTRH